MFPGICKWRGAGLPSLSSEARGWEPNARGAPWEREPRTGEPAAFLPDEGQLEEPPGQGAKPPGAGRLEPESLPPVRIPPALGLCRVYGFLCVLHLECKPPIKFGVCFLQSWVSWPVVFLVSRDFPGWGKPAGQFGVRKFRRCLSRLILEVVSCLYGPKCLLEPAWPRLGPSRRHSVLEALGANFQRAVGSRFVRRLGLGRRSCERQCLRHLGAGAARAFGTCA